ncbi:MAG: glycosyltransferase family 4 protein [Sphingobium sp.]|nr:glycosyltransferase family 4 protein [Sphingobium sp.]
MSPAARFRADRGQLAILQLHGRFDGSAKDQRVARLMNHWGDKARHDLLLADPGNDAGRSLIDAAVPARLLDKPVFGPKGGPGRFVALAQLMRDYDLVLSFGWGAIDGVITQRLLGLLMGLPPLIHHEDGTGLHEVGPLGFGSDFYRRYSLSAARALVVPTGRLAHVAIDHWGEAAAHVKQIPDGIDVASYAGNRSRSEIPGLVSDERVVIGARVEDASPQMLDQLLRAVAPLEGKARLVLLDAPGEDAVLKTRAEALGLGHLLAPRDLPRPQDYLGALDIFVLLAERDPSTLALTEAMAAGLPVVATEPGDVAEMLAAANRPFVMAPGNDAALAKALSKLAGDAVLRSELGKANQNRARQCFDESVMFELYGRLYGGAIGREVALL